MAWFLRIEGDGRAPTLNLATQNEMIGAHEFGDWERRSRLRAGFIFIYWVADSVVSVEDTYRRTIQTAKSLVIPCSKFYRPVFTN